MSQCMYTTQGIYVCVPDSSIINNKKTLHILGRTNCDFSKLKKNIRL